MLLDRDLLFREKKVLLNEWRLGKASSVRATPAVAGNMATHLRVSVFILWLTLALAVSIGRGDIYDIVTEYIFYNILYGDTVTLSGAKVGEIVSLFDEIISAASNNCTGKNFYKYGDFFNATSTFPHFGTTGAINDSNREIAAFFATVAYVTGNLCYVEAIDKSCKYKDCCDPNYSLQYPCTPGKQYYGRGPIQLTWNEIYGNASSYLGFAGLNEPEIVAQDGIISWKTALWSWMERDDGNGTCHSAITSGQGFGETIKVTMGTDFCKSHDINDLISFYTNYCSKLSVDAGSNLTC